MKANRSTLQTLRVLGLLAWLSIASVAAQNIGSGGTEIQPRVGFPCPTGMVWATVQGRARCVWCNPNSQPGTQTQTVSCPPGQTGQATQTQTYSCDAATNSWVGSGWVTTGSSCLVAEVDQCLNMPGMQATVPPNLVRDFAGNCRPGDACQPGTLYSAPKVEDYNGLGQDSCDGGDIIWMSYVCADVHPPTVQFSTNVKNAAPFAFSVSATSFDRTHNFSNCVGRWQGSTSCNGAACTTQVTMSIGYWSPAVCGGGDMYPCEYGDGGTTWCVNPFIYCVPEQLVWWSNGQIQSTFSYTTNLIPPP
jgi:hypothetical protein